MNTRLNKFAIIFLILMVAIPFISFSVGATETTIDGDLRDLNLHMRNIVVRSDGVMFSAQYNNANPSFAEVYRSADSGATWFINGSFACSWSVTDSVVCLGVDNSDTVHLFYAKDDGGLIDVMHRELTTTGAESWTDGNIVFNTAYASSVYTSMDLLFDSDNMHFVYTWYHEGLGIGSYIRFESYNFILETWGDATTLVLKTGSEKFHNDVSLVSYGNDIIAIWSNSSGNDFIQGAYYTTSTNTWSSHFTIASSDTYTYINPCAINYNGKIYVFYSGNTSDDDTVRSLLYKTYQGSWSGQSSLHADTGYHQYNPTASITSGGSLNVIWSGRSSISSSYYQLRQKVYSGGEWGNTAFVSSGSTNKRYSHLLYQEYPYFTHLTNGVALTYKDDTNNDFEYIDSGSLIWYAGEESGYEGEFEFDANNNIGTLDTGCIMNVADKDIEFKYQVPTTINATGFDLLVGNAMHGYANDLSNYDLYINGEPMGNPTEWKAYGSQYVLRWTFDSELEISNSEILFEVWHDQLVSGYSYWFLGVSCGYEDLDGDGIPTMRYSNTYPNGVFDGTWLAKDVAYQIYFNVISFVEDETPVDYNTITAVNTTYYVGESVPLTYTIKASDLVYDNYVRIWNDDTSTEITAGSMQGFPHLTQHQVETIGFVPFTSANYTAHLYINAVEVDNTSFFVDEQINANMSVFTYENPSNVGQKIWVYYNFDHPTGKSGAIFVSHTPSMDNYISINYLSDGDSGFWTTSHDTVGVYYYIMAVDTTGNGTYGIVNNGIHPHTVKSEHGNNFFTLRWSNLRLGIDGTTTQTISGESNMVSGNCYIYDNNKLVKTITESPFHFSYSVQTAGLHTVEMRLISNLTIVLWTQNYTVTTYTGDEEIEQVEDSGYVIRDYIYNEWGDFGIFIAGVGIILGFMLIPFFLVLYVNVNFNKNIALGDLHWSIYLIFAIVGVAVTVMLHIADLWLILLIVVACITIAVVIFKGNGNG